MICSRVGAFAERVQHDGNGLLFNVGDSRDLAETIRRACEEEYLWDRLAAGLPKPPERASMVQGYLDVYQNAKAALSQG